MTAGVAHRLDVQPGPGVSGYWFGRFEAPTLISVEGPARDDRRAICSNVVQVHRHLLTWSKRRPADDDRSAVRRDADGGLSWDGLSGKRAGRLDHGQTDTNEQREEAVHGLSPAAG